MIELDHKGNCLLVNSVDTGFGENNIQSCSTSGCRQKSALIAGSVLGGGLALVFCLSLICICYRYWQGRPLKSNETFIECHQNRYVPTDFDQLISGLWLCRYLENGKWRKTNHLLLLFNYETNQVNGSGTDYHGSFHIEGIFSRESARMALTKTYPKTSQQQNERIFIQLTWNSNNRLFQGKWYIHTKTYRAENKIFLKYQHQPQISFDQTI